MHSLSFLALLFVLVCLVISQQSSFYRFGPHYSLGPTQSYIVYAETTLYPGKTPQPQQDRLALWAGMGTDSGNLIQGIIVSLSQERKQCNGKPGQWCVFASVLQGTQRMGKQYALDPEKGVTVKYVYDEHTRVTNQTMSVNGKVISSLSLASGKAKGWGTAVECQQACSGNVNAHRYDNTTIKLAASDQNFRRTLAILKATATPFTSTDSQIYKVDRINIQAHTFGPCRGKGCPSGKGTGVLMGKAAG